MSNYQLTKVSADDYDERSLDEMPLDKLNDILSLTIRHDRNNKLITFLCMLSAYTNSSQLNVSFNAPSSSGKTYMTTELAKLFPDDDKIALSGASPTSFFHGEGKYDKQRKAKIVSLERKILLMYEQPNPLLQQKLRAVLSHDERELHFRITNKDKKGANRAEHIIIRGFPATVFCSAGMQLDEQEATRAILLSPEVTEEKLKDGIHLQAQRGSNEVAFDEWLESQPERIALKQRIRAIKDEKIEDIIIDNPDLIEERFNKMFGKPKARHMRDMGHLMKLIKVIALFNVWHRKRPDLNDAIIAHQYDIDLGFELWSTVVESQDLNVPPAVLNFYKNIILPAYYEKKNDSKYRSDMEYSLVGLSSYELSGHYLKAEQTTLNDEHLRKQILPQLVNSGIIKLEQPINGDKRSKHIFPQWFPPGSEHLTEENNVGEDGGELDDPMNDLDDDTYELFFGKRK